MNEYFDSSNRQDPVKRLITDQYQGFFNPKMFNMYKLFVERNTYEIEGGLFHSQKNGKLYSVVKERAHITELFEDKVNKVFLNFEISLDQKITHFRSTSYGIVDVIGTLGGAFGIISWLLMLFYGSIREGVYLFSVINHLN